MSRKLLVNLASTLIFGRAPISQAQNPALLLQHVTVIDATGTELRKAVDVLIRGNRIEKIASQVSPPRSSRVVPANGKFLIPGLGTCTCTSGTQTWHSRCFWPTG
jgi:predicted amidohydrolase